MEGRFSRATSLAHLYSGEKDFVVFSRENEIEGSLFFDFGYSLEKSVFCLI